MATSLKLNNKIRVKHGLIFTIYAVSVHVCHEKLLRINTIQH